MSFICERCKREMQTESEARVHMAEYGHRRIKNTMSIFQRRAYV